MQMTTIYLKSADEQTVVSLRGKNPTAEVAGLEGFIQISKTEFFRLKKFFHNHPTPVESGEIKFNSNQIALDY
jgi:hypothetical protein